MTPPPLLKSKGLGYPPSADTFAVSLDGGVYKNNGGERKEVVG